MSKAHRIKLWKESRTDMVDSLKKTRLELIKRINRLYQGVEQVDQLIKTLRRGSRPIRMSKSARELFDRQNAKTARVTKNVT
jgi:hypothetical protein